MRKGKRKEGKGRREEESRTERRRGRRKKAGSTAWNKMWTEKCHIRQHEGHL